MERRDFLGAMTAGTALLTSATTAEPALPEFETPPDTVRGGMRYRRLGRTGEPVSMIGLGGHHIGRQKEESESIRIIRSAIDAGSNFLDNSRDYHDGGSEIRMGKALRDGGPSVGHLSRTARRRSRTTGPPPNRLLGRRFSPDRPTWTTPE